MTLLICPFLVQIVSMPQLIVLTRILWKIAGVHSFACKFSLDQSCPLSATLEYLSSRILIMGSKEGRFLQRCPHYSLIKGLVSMSVGNRWAFRVARSTEVCLGSSKSISIALTKQTLVINTFFISLLKLSFANFLVLKKICKQFKKCKNCLCFES